MDIKQQLKALLQEAEVYYSQGLMNEAAVKYRDGIKLITSAENLKNRESILEAISRKLASIEKTQDKAHQEPVSPELSQKAQDLIKNLFAFAENKDADNAALEGAVILAKFGQIERALKELNALLLKDNVRVEAAKNILRCYLASASADEAIVQYHTWHASDLFQPGQLETVRVYLEEMLRKRGTKAELPAPKDVVEPEAGDSMVDIVIAKEPEEEFLDITSIGITFENGPQKGQTVEFDVNFQSGNMLSLIISKQDQAVIEELREGVKLHEIQFFSPIAIFNGAGVVTSKTQIKSGPKQGDFCLDIRIVSS
jgi:tetratricopeptide (TPR) repeat protein